MSANSLSNSSIEQSPGNSWRKAVSMLCYILWVAGSFIVAQLVVGGALIGLVRLGVNFSDVKESVLMSSVTFIVYALTLLIVIGVPWIRKRRTSLADVGLQRWPEWFDVLAGPLAVIPYFIVSGLLLLLASRVPGFDVSQAQDVGFSGVLGRFDLVLAFLTLVVLAPVVEETIFRGYLYGHLRKIGGRVVAILLTSLCFGILHFQLNVGLDVFVLSLVLCVLREITGSIWAGILLHMTKNFIAFYILFVAPLMVH